MTFLGLKRKVIFFIVNNILVGTKHFKSKRKLLCISGIKIGEGTKIVGPVHCTADLEIGKNCWVGKNFIINGNGRVKIGDNCDIAPEVIIQTGGHEIGNSTRRAGKDVLYDVTIGNGCWIGARSSILGNVIVEDGSIIAACACVCKNVKASSLVGGVPAKLIKCLEKGVITVEK